MKKLSILLVLVFVSCLGFSQGVGVEDATPDALLDVLNTGAGDSFRVDDDADGDATPFIIDAIGNVGIGTATPNSLAKLELLGNGLGFLVPRMTVANRPAGVGATHDGLMIYNTDAGAEGIGFYYWDNAASAWKGFGKGWNILGNTGTAAGTNFVGTTDANALDFRTNNTIRMQITNGNQLLTNNGTTALPFFSFIADPNTGMWSSGADQLSFSEGATEAFRITSADGLQGLLGTVALPTWSFMADPNTGMWSAGADNLNFSTNGIERLEFGTVEAVFNDPSNDYDFRVESNASTHGLFVDAGNNRVGINTTVGATTVPQEELDVRGTMIGALPLIAVDCMRQRSPDADNNDPDVVCVNVASVPSTGNVWLRNTDNTNRNIEDHDTDGNWDAWTDFGNPCGGCGVGYIMSLDVTLIRGQDSDEDEWQAMIMVRWSDGNVYIRVTDDGDYDITDMDNTGNWANWVNLNAGPGM